MSEPRKIWLLGAVIAIGLMFTAVLFARVAEAQDQAVGDAAQRGKAVFDYWCAPCHAPGPGHPGTQSLEFRYRGEVPAALEARENLTPEYVKAMVRQGLLMMAPFRKTEITDAELDDLARYLAD